MAVLTPLRGAHFKDLIRNYYGFYSANHPQNVVNWLGIQAGTVNTNFHVLFETLEPLREKSGKSGLVEHQVVITLFESGGVDALLPEEVGSYMLLLCHIDDRVLQIKDLRGRQVKFRVPAPYHPTKCPVAESIERKLFVDFRFKPIDASMSLVEYQKAYKTIVHPESSKPVAIMPFIGGDSAVEILDDSGPPNPKLKQLRPNDYMDEDQIPHRPLKLCYMLGRALAAFHLAAQDFRLPDGTKLQNRFGVHNWPTILKSIEQPFAERRLELASSNRFVRTGFVADLAAQVGRICDRWTESVQGLPCGTIHGDLFPDNTRIRGLDRGEGIRGDLNLGIIDIWSAGYDVLSYDIAITLNAWCIDSSDNSFYPERWHAILAGYDSVRQRTEAEYEALPFLLEAAATRFALTRANMWVCIDLTESSKIELRSPDEMLNQAISWATSIDLNQSVIGSDIPQFKY